MDISTSSVKRIIEYYGSENQKLKALEELSELQAEILKEINKGTTSGLPGEIADVYIMLKQLMLIYEIDPGILNDMIEIKIKRQLQRMSKQ